LFSHGKTNGSFCKVPESAIVKAAAPGQLEHVGIVVTFTVESIEDTLAKAQKAGGSVHL
jgi:predicted enzyme related to lactoylglutathione lyase